MQSQCWKTPVRLRLAVRSPGGEQTTSSGQEVLGPVPQLVGDLEGVAEEVALGVADVAAVQPDVGLVEDAVEHQPGPLAVGGAVGREAATR